MGRVRSLPLAPLVDLPFAAAAAVTVPAVRDVLERSGWPAVTLFLLACVAFCVAIVLVRGLPHDAEALAQDPEKGRGGWLALCVMIFSAMTMFGMFERGGEFGGKVISGEEDGGLASLAALGGLVILFLPFIALWKQNVPQWVTPIAKRGAELGALVAANLASLVMVAYWEYMIVFRGAEAGGQMKGPPERALLIAALMPPLFWMMAGAPRILMLAREFTWVGFLSLYLSTGWYLFGIATL